MCPGWGRGGEQGFLSLTFLFLNFEVRTLSKSLLSTTAPVSVITEYSQVVHFLFKVGIAYSVGWWLANIF